MRIAIVHDFFYHKFGGAERVFLQLAKLYPEADLFALIYNEKVFKSYVNRPIRTSFLNHLPHIVRNNPKFSLPLIKRAVESLDFTGYDLVITSSTAWVKNVRIPHGTKHLCYCHSPARMLWDSWPGYLQTVKIGPFRIGPISRFIISRWVSTLRLWDFYGSQNVTQFVANSYFVAKRISKFYRRQATVIYPPVDIATCNDNQPKEDYYLIVSVLSRYKNIDLAIKAFTKTSRKLWIVGDGPDRQRLEKLAKAHDNIAFRGYVEDSQKFDLLSKAKALIFPSVEDFGITSIEAMASNTPVIALKGGGVNETVIDGKTGLFFDKAAAQSLLKTIEQFEMQAFNQADLSGQAKKFSTSVFEREFSKLVKKVMVL